tara:strand:+ start:285 stop:1043 length:759 start_codon:yes stop_codon:yes gene_type:complete
MNENTPINGPSDNMTQEAVDSILENLPTELETEVNLPSRCRFYTLPDPASPVSVRPMTFEDEKAIATIKKSDRMDPINYLLSKCVNNINISELLLMDKLFLLYKLREVSYGPFYKVGLTCPKCASNSEVNIDISKLLINEVPDDLTDPRTIHLPTLKKDAIVRFPRLVDEKYLNILETKKVQFWRFVKDIAGHTDKKVISKVIDKLPLTDMHLLIEKLTMPEYGLDSKINYVCGDCEGESVIELPIGDNFFS